MCYTLTMEYLLFNQNHNRNFATLNLYIDHTDKLHIQKKPHTKEIEKPVQ